MARRNRERILAAARAADGLSVPLDEIALFALRGRRYASVSRARAMLACVTRP